MALEAGMRLGPYEITAPIGAGGMGEVYRATDTRLDRVVAVKVISGDLSATAERRERFRREARAISSLSHPRICALHDVGEEDGIAFLVLEHLEGETLAERIRRGPLPLEEALRIGAGIAEGLDAAHRKGLVHRDLKPANVMLTGAGVKLMDFGLAKAVGDMMENGRPELACAPTRSSPLTVRGAVVGTLNYISPEQLEGKETDASSDIFALGAVLYEMLTARKAFAAGSAAGVMAAVLASDLPPVSELRPSIPPSLDRLVRTCLARKREERRRSAHDLMLDLKLLADEAGVREGTDSSASRSRVRIHAAWGVATVFLAVLAAFGLLRSPPSSAVRSPVRFELAAPAETTYSISVETHNIAVSPDGTELAFVSVQAGQPWIWIRPLGSSLARRLPGTEGAMSPFWSPDGRNVAFFAKGNLVRVPVEGGPAQILCSLTGVEWTGDWSTRGDIIFTEFVGREGVHKVPATGGDPVPVLDPDAVGQNGFRWPHWLPDGEHFLYSAFDAGDNLAVYVGTVDTGESRVLLAAPSRAQYASDYLLFARNKTLMAQPFHAAKLELSGEPVPLAEDLPYFLTGWAPFSVSRGGVLAYQAGDTRSQLVWFDREGRQVAQIGKPAEYVSTRLSPDGQKVAAAIDRDGENSDIWLIDVSRGTSTRFTSEGGRKSPPVWSPDGRFIAYSLHGRNVTGGVFVKAVDGSSSVEVVPRDAVFQFPSDWSADDRWILFSRIHPESGFDIWLLPRDGDQEPFPLLGTEFHEWEAVLSPDGEWMAYLSDEAGRSAESMQVTPGTLDVYVRPFRRPGEPVRISPEGGFAPRWSRDGKELFYVTADRGIQVVPVRLNGGFHIGVPRTLFTPPAMPDPESLGAMFSVSDDGRRFLTAVGGTAAHLPITVTLDWTADLDR